MTIREMMKLLLESRIDACAAARAADRCPPWLPEADYRRALAALDAVVDVLPDLLDAVADGDVVTG